MIKQAILDKVTKDDHVTFAEITRMDGCGGDYELFRPDVNVVLWQHLSLEAIEAIEELREEGRIHYDVCHWLVYVVDGGFLNLTIVKRRPPPGGFKKTCWLPTTLRPGPSPSL